MDFSSDRPLPSAVEMEREVLGAAMVYQDLHQDVAPIIRSSQAFYTVPHAEIWKAIDSIARAGRVPTPSLVGYTLAEAGKAEACGGMAYIANLLASASSQASAIEAARVVAEKAMARAVISACYQGAMRIWGSDTDVISEVAAMTKSLADAISPVTATDEVKRLGDDMALTLAELEAVRNGEATDGIGVGLSDVDRYFRLRPGEVAILAARPSVGKTAFAVQAAVTLAIKGGTPSVLFSLEMSRAMLRRRALLQLAELGYQDIAERNVTNERWEKLAATSKIISGLPVWCDDSSRTSIDSIRASATRLRNSVGISLVIIDYLQLIRPAKARGTREAEVSEISAGCKQIAKELDVPVLVLAQLNRQAEEKPRVCHLRESGAIEQDADVIALMGPGDRLPTGAIPVELNVAKHRNGPTGVANLLFFPKTTTFGQATRFNDDDVRFAQGGYQQGPQEEDNETV